MRTNAAFSGGASRVVYSRKPEPKKPIPKAIWYALAAFIALGILSAGVWYFINLPYFRVDRIDVSGVYQLPALDIERAAREALAGKQWFIFPKNNFFLISSYRTRDHLREAFPQAAKISVEKKFPNRLIVAVEERTLWGVVCTRPDAALPPESCFYIDRRGMAYEELASVEGWLIPIIYIPEKSALGTRVVPEATLDFFNQAKGALVAINGNLILLAVSSSTPSDIRLTLSENWDILVSSSRPPSEWMKILRTVLDKDIGDKRSNLEYVDLRFGNKVFYKFKNGK